MAVGQRNAVCGRQGPLGAVSPARNRHGYNVSPFDPSTRAYATVIPPERVRAPSLLDLSVAVVVVVVVAATADSTAATPSMVFPLSHPYTATESSPRAKYPRSHPTLHNTRARALFSAVTDRAHEHRQPDRVHDQAACGDDRPPHQVFQQDHLQASAAGNNETAPRFDLIFLLKRA